MNKAVLVEIREGVRRQRTQVGYNVDALKKSIVFNTVQRDALAKTKHDLQSAVDGMLGAEAVWGDELGIVIGD